MKIGARLLERSLKLVRISSSLSDTLGEIRTSKQYLSVARFLKRITSSEGEGSFTILQVTQDF